MLKKSLLIAASAAIFVVVLVLIFHGPKQEVKPPVASPEAVKTDAASKGEAAHVIINSLRYRPSMANALKPRSAFSMQWGDELEQVGGFKQDHYRLTEGLPWGFRAPNVDKLWVLDSMNKRLKLFNIQGKVEYAIDLHSMGTNIMDFAYSSKGVFAFYNNVSGEIYFVDKTGKSIGDRPIKGFLTANAIEFASDGCLLVDLPIAGGVVKVAVDGQLKGIYKSDSLSLIESVNGGIYGLKLKGREAHLTLRKELDESTEEVIHKFVYDHPEDREVWYAGGEIYGKDAKGNIYIGLVVCDESGIIYTDKIYRCTAEGEPIGSIDVVTDPELTSALPRKRVVTPDGRVLFASYDENRYTVSAYEIPNELK